MTLEEAISTHVQDGDLVGLGGLSFWRKPIGACREIIRQKKKNLSLCTFVGGIEKQNEPILEGRLIIFSIFL
ncbi:MAG: hypothetical protein ACFFKA_06035, partial [Candidatus Thorarchaeota archaeon]